MKRDFFKYQQFSIKFVIIKSQTSENANGHSANLGHLVAFLMRFKKNPYALKFPLRGNRVDGSSWTI